jgi:hypothetical protein
MNNVLATGVNLLLPWSSKLAEAAMLGRSVEVATTTDVAVEYGGKNEPGTAAEAVGRVCAVLNEVGPCSLSCWLLVRVTKEVAVGAGMDRKVEIDSRVPIVDHCEELGGIRASGTLCKTPEMLVDTGPSSCKDDATATASNTGLGWFFPGSSPAYAAPCIKGVYVGELDVIGDNIIDVLVGIDRTRLPL